MRKILLLFFSLLFLFCYCSQPQRQPDEVRVRLASDPETLSPVNYASGDALQIINLLFQSLLGSDLADDKLKPVLAVSFPLIERNDTVTYITYTIREEATWADGSPVTAQDVVFTLKVLKAPLLNNERMRPQVEFIRDVVLDKSNSRKFTFICNGYTPEMELLSGDFFILPAYLFDPENLLKNISVASLSESPSELENNKQLQSFAARFNSVEFARNPQFLKGSGGYELDNWTSGQYLTLKRKENWWGNQASINATHITANPLRITFQIIPDNTTALLALKNRQLDVLENIMANEFDQLKQDEGFLQEYDLYTPSSYEFVFVGLNSRQPKLSDKKTRQALSHLLDINSLISVTQNNYATPTVGIIPPSVEQYYHDGLKPYQFSPDRAENLLKAAGWVKDATGWFKNINGTKQQLSVEVIYRAGNNVFENSALIFQQNAAKVGIPVTLQALESSMLLQKSRNHEFDMFFRALQGNPFIFNFEPLLHTDYATLGNINYTGFGTPESDQVLEKLTVAETEKEKTKLLRRLQEIMYDEAAFVPLYYYKRTVAVHNRFNNIKISGLKPNYDVSAFTLKE